MSINIVTAGGIPVDGNHFSKNGYLNDQYFDLFAPPPISITSWGGDLDYIQNKIKKYEFSKSEHNSRSISNRLLDEPSLIDLKKFIIGFVHRYTENVLRSTQKINLLNSWGNLEYEGDSHPPHFHPNSYLSGVMFIKSEFDSPPLILENNLRPYQLSVDLFSDDKSFLPPNEFGNCNMRVATIQSIPGRVVLFPSPITHHVPKSKSKGERITIAFNTYPELPFGSESKVTHVF